MRATEGALSASARGRERSVRAGRPAGTGRDEPDGDPLLAPLSAGAVRPLRIATHHLIVVCVCVSPCANVRLNAGQFQRQSTDGRLRPAAVSSRLLRYSSTPAYAPPSFFCFRRNATPPHLPTCTPVFCPLSRKPFAAAGWPSAEESPTGDGQMFLLSSRSSIRGERAIDVD